MDQYDRWKTTDPSDDAAQLTDDALAVVEAAVKLWRETAVKLWRETNYPRVRDLYDDYLQTINEAWQSVTGDYDAPPDASPPTVWHDLEAEMKGD